MMDEIHLPQEIGVLLNEKMSLNGLQIIRGKEASLINFLANSINASVLFLGE